MFVIKLISAACIVGGSSYIGFGFASGLNRQLQQIKLLQSALAGVESALRFENASLRAVFSKLAAENSLISDFFQYTLEKMGERLPLKTIWQSYHDKNKAAIPNRAIHIFCHIAQTLEGSDTEASLSALKLAQQELTAVHNECYGEYKSKMKAYPAVGLLSGLFVAVLFI